MSFAKQADIDSLPPLLRRLLDAELAVGNEVIEIGYSHPAPPIGAYFKLARPVTSRPRDSSDGLKFYERNSSLSSGEFTDADRRYWILEAARADAGAYPDMDAIRAAAQPPPFVPREPTSEESPSWMRFVQSREMNFERWKEGIGYDLEALGQLSPTEQASVESSLTPPRGWRDVEALAELATPTAEETLRQAVRSEDIEVRLAVLRDAPELIDDKTRTEVLLQALAEAEAFAGRTEVLDLVLEFHPPEIIEALFAGLLTFSGEMAYHCAATLAAIHGIVDSRYDWSLRPQYLAFNTDDTTARHGAFLTLCTTLGIDGPTRLTELIDGGC